LLKDFEGTRTVMHSPVQSGTVYKWIGNKINNFNALGGIIWLRTKRNQTLFAPIL